MLKEKYRRPQSANGSQVFIQAFDNGSTVSKALARATNFQKLG